MSGRGTLVSSPRGLRDFGRNFSLDLLSELLKHVIILYRVPEGWGGKAVTVKQKSWLLTNHASNMVLLNNMIISLRTSSHSHFVSDHMFKHGIKSGLNWRDQSHEHHWKTKDNKPKILTRFGWTNWCRLQSGTNGNNYQLQLQFQTRTNDANWVGQERVLCYSWWTFSVGLIAKS